MPEATFQPLTPTPAAAVASSGAPLIEIASLSLFYGQTQALKNISLSIRERLVTAFIGPSGCGKSTLLRCLNRMNDLIDNVRINGQVRIGGHDIHGLDVDVIEPLIVCGADDAGALEPSLFLAATLPHAELVVVPEAGHLVKLEQPARFNEALRGWLGAIEW